MKTHNTSFRALIAVVPLYMLLCTGGSTEIGNARAVITGSITDSGRNVDSAQVQLVAEDYIPGNATVDKVFSTLTDCRGNYRFEEVPLGNYYLNAESSGKRLLRGPIEIAETEKDLAADPLHETSQLTISIPESSAVNVVFVQGVARTWSVASGTVVLDSVPSGAVTVVGFTQSGQVPKSLSSDNSVKLTVDVLPQERAVATFDNAPPRILTSKSELPGVVSRTDGTYNVVIHAEDPEGEVVRFALLTAPQGMSIDNASGKITWKTGDSTSAGVYPVGVRATDMKGASSSLSWTVTVAAGQFLFSSLTGKTTGYSLHTYIFQAELSNEMNACRFSWGDGDTTSWQAASAAAHLWKSAGTFLVSFQEQYASDGSFSQWSEPVLMELKADIVPPVFSMTDSAPMVKIGAAFIDPITAWDDVDGNVTGRIIKTGTVNTDQAGTYHIAYTVTDLSGNTAAMQQTVVVVGGDWRDTVAPAITLLGPDTMYLPETLTIVEFISNYEEPGYSATDDVDGNITGYVKVSGITQLSKTVWYITYDVTDAAGNAAATRKRVVITSGSIPLLPPIIDLVYPDSIIQIPVGGIWREPGYSASDVVDGDLTAGVIVDSLTLISHLNVPGNYNVIYSVTSSSGLSAQKIRNVRIVKSSIDTIAPVITLNGAVMIYCLDSVTPGLLKNSFREPGYSAVDDRDGDITGKVKVVLDTTPVSKRVPSIGYTVTDNAGNISDTAFRWFFNEGSTGITIDLADNDSLIRIPVSNGKWVEPGYAASDNVEGDITAKVVVDSSDLIGHIRQPGVYYVIYSVPYKIESNVVRRVRAVEVYQDFIDEPTPPEIFLKGPNPDTVIIGSASNYIDPGAVVLDAKDGDITDRLTVSGSVNMNMLGKYSINYSVTDLSGNTARATRVVWVVRDPATTDLLIRYGVPGNSPIPDLLGKTYMKVTIDGDGPDPDSIGGLFIYWSLTYDTLNTLFLLVTSDSSSDTIVVDLTSKTQQTFSSSSPEIKLSGTGIPGLDGKYYAGVSSGEIYWVEQSGRYAIIWRE